MMHCVSTQKVWQVRKARIGDAAAIHRLVKTYSDKGALLPVSLSEVYERLRDFFVCECEGRIVGCGALRIVWDNLAEVRSLAVVSDMARQGVGRAIVEACLTEARALEVPRVFALTYEAEFFAKLGFEPVAKEKLPHKIWLDCVKCAKFPNCDEHAVIHEMR